MMKAVRIALFAMVFLGVGLFAQAQPFSETAIFQEGVSDANGANTSYDMICSYVRDHDSFSAGASELIPMGQGWNNDYNNWAVLKFDLSSLQSFDPTITGATLTVTSSGAVIWEESATGSPAAGFPMTCNWRLFKIKAANYDLAEGVATALGDPDGNGAVDWAVQQKDVACWTVSGCTAAGLWPENHWSFSTLSNPNYPSGESTFNVEEVPVATGASTGDQASYDGKEIVLTFTSAELANLEAMVDDPTQNAGYLLQCPDEYFGVGPTIYGWINIAADDNPAAAIRPKLEIDFDTLVPVELSAFAIE